MERTYVEVTTSHHNDSSLPLPSLTAEQNQIFNGEDRPLKMALALYFSGWNALLNTTTRICRILP